LPDLIIRYRKLAHLQHVYFDGVFGCATRGDGWLVRGATSDGGRRDVIHANFLQDGSDTGRFSCAEPNLQNLPRVAGDDGGDSAASGDDFVTLSAAVRRAFLPTAEGHVLAAFDYEQIELRVLAHLCRDPTLIGTLSSADPRQRDIHRRIAASVFRKSFDAVTAHERSNAKRVVFGVLYGMGVATLAASLGEPVDFAAQLQRKFRDAFPRIDELAAAVRERCRVEGCVRTLLHRRRPLPDLTSTNQQKRAAAARQAFNTVIQGSAADVVRKAMADVHTQILQALPLHDSGGVFLLCQVHDELIFSIRSDLVPTLIPRIKAAMENAMRLQVPLPVKVSVGSSLGELEAWHP
jgi:DNA polymerase-1